MEQVRQALFDAYPAIRDIHIHDVFMGEGRHAMGSVGSTANTARQEVIRSLLVTIPPDQELGIAIADRAIRLGCLMRDPMYAAGIRSNHSSVVFGLVEATQKRKLLHRLTITRRTRLSILPASCGKTSARLTRSQYSNFMSLSRQCGIGMPPCPGSNIFPTSRTE